MADVSVEFGASDTGLAQTLKTIQTELATLEEQQKTTAMSAEEFQKSLSKIKQLEGLEAKIQGMAQATREVAEAAKAAAEPARDLSEEFKKISEPLLTVNERLSKTRSELADLKDKASTAYMRTEELEDALKKISELEGTERRLAKIAKETDAAGIASLNTPAANAAIFPFTASIVSPAASKVAAFSSMTCSMEPTFSLASSSAGEKSLSNGSNLPPSLSPNTSDAAAARAVGSSMAAIFAAKTSICWVGILPASAESEMPRLSIAAFCLSPPFAASCMKFCSLLITVPT